VESANNNEAEDGRVWEVVSEFDASTNPLRTAADLCAFRDAELNTRADSKKELRKQRQVKHNLEEGLLDFSDDGPSVCLDAMILATVNKP